MRLTKQQATAIAEKIHKSLSDNVAKKKEEIIQAFLLKNKKDIEKNIAAITKLKTVVGNDMSASLFVYSLKNNQKSIADWVKSFYISKMDSSAFPKAPSLSDIERDVIISSVDADSLDALYKRFGI